MSLMTMGRGAGLGDRVVVRPMLNFLDIKGGGMYPIN